MKPSYNSLWLLPISVIIIVGTARAQSTLPRTISFQGSLVDNEHRPVADGNHSLTIALYDQPIGGVPLFTETAAASTVDGIFGIQIGAATVDGIPRALTFDRQY